MAIRGLGGFHLCVNGCSAVAVATLRRHVNRRPDKPLAIMVKDLDRPQRLCYLSDLEKRDPARPSHPIVLLQAKPGSTLAQNLAPDMIDIGLMLPYTPLHHLLFANPDCPDGPGDDQRQQSAVNRSAPPTKMPCIVWRISPIFSCCTTAISSPGSMIRWSSEWR